MTMLERVPNPFHAAQKKLRGLSEPFIRRYASPYLPLSRRPDDRRELGSTQDAVDGEMYFAESKCTARMTKIITLADTQGAKIIGLTGTRTGVGVSVAARQLATALGSFGRPALLVDASRIDFFHPDEQRRTSSSPDLLDHRVAISRDVAVVDLAADPLWAEQRRDELRRSFETATEAGYTVVVDLPPVAKATGEPIASLATVGAACDLVLLVCLSGSMMAKELGSCVETCGIVGVKLGGLILNDWRLPVSGLLE